MHQTLVEIDVYDRRGIRRAWRNTDGQLHRTTGSAREDWTVLPGGARVLSYQAWYVNGEVHREGRPAYRRWHVAVDGARVLTDEAWWQHGRQHRVGGPSYRYWTVTPDGIRTLQCESWRVNGKLHRVDGPACDGRWFYWDEVRVREEDLPWLRRGRTCLTLLTAPPCGKGAPAWSRDRRVTMARTDPLSTAATLATYHSAVGGVVLLCV